MDEAAGGLTARAQARRATRMHDLRTPLCVVVGRVQLLRRRKLRRIAAPRPSTIDDTLCG